MRKHIFTVILLTALVLTGCRQTVGKAGEALDRLEDTLEDKLDQMEERLETVPDQMKRTQKEETAAGLTKEEAESIALEDAGVTADQVSALRTEYEMDDGVPQYEVDFRQDRWEYTYTIHGEDGRILDKEVEENAK